MDFHQIFRICLPQEDLELIRFWGVSGKCFEDFWALKFVGILLPKPMHGFRICVSQEVLDLVRFFLGGGMWQHLLPWQQF